LYLLAVIFCKDILPDCNINISYDISCILDLI
jgi:hypothetical protein